MRILGISGFHRSMGYKAGLFPSFDARFHRMCQGMDAAAALVEDGRIVAAAAEERFNGRKHSNLFPIQAIEYCLREGGCAPKDVDRVAHGFDHSLFRNYFNVSRAGRDWYEKVLSPDVVFGDLMSFFGDGFPREKFVPVSHHLAHAASAYHLSGFDDSLVIVADGMGEVHSVTVFDGDGGTLRPLAQIPYGSSLGNLYSLVTFHLGFDFAADEYKTMGLAPYGDPERYRTALERFLQLSPDGYKLSFAQPETTDFGRETFRRTREMMADEFFPPRREEEPLEQKHKDLAAGLQAMTNRVMTHLASVWLKKTGRRRLCLAGGVALNCVANEKILALQECGELFVQPAAGDDGAALGAAVHVAVCAGQRFGRMGMPFWGPSSSEAQIERIFASASGSLFKRKHSDPAQTAERISSLVARGKVIGLYQGRMEFGPRALGNRSILADARDPRMRDHVNAVVKKRESFRPFAPAVTEEALCDIFETPKGRAFPYMLVTLPVKTAWRDRLPAVTHVDGSARVQSVSRSQNPLLHATLEAFGKTTGVPVLLNTSFNMKGQTIVHDPQEALDTFLTTDIDSLFLNGHEISKSSET